MEKVKSSFLLSKYDYNTGKKSIIDVYTDKLNAYYGLESYVINYIIEKDGDNKMQNFKLEDFIIFAGKKIPEGHFINLTEKKWTIKCNKIKKIKGWITNSHVSNEISIFDIEVIELPISQFNKLYKIYKKACRKDEGISYVEATDIWSKFTDDFVNSKTYEYLNSIDFTVDNPKPSHIRNTISDEAAYYVRTPCTRSEAREIEKFQESFIFDMAEENCDLVDESISDKVEKHLNCRKFLKETSGKYI